MQKPHLRSKLSRFAMLAVGLVVLLFLKECAWPAPRRFSSGDWTENGYDLLGRSNRTLMLSDLIESNRLIGLHRAEAVALLGPNEKTGADALLRYRIGPLWILDDFSSTLTLHFDDEDRIKGASSPYLSIGDCGYGPVK